MYMGSRIIGLSPLAVRVGYLGGAMDWWDPPVFSPGWWMPFLTTPAVFSFLEDGSHFGDGRVPILGAYLLCSVNDWTSIRLMRGMPVVIGLTLLDCRMIIGDNFLRLKHSNSILQEEDDRHDLCNVTYFGSKRLNVHGIVYLLKVENVFGTQMIDLVDVDLTKYGYMKLETMLGSVDLLVSDRVHYHVKSENMLGNTRVKHYPEDLQDLAADIPCVFGTINSRKVHAEDDVLNGKCRKK